MGELVLARRPGERRAYVLPGAGTLRFGRWLYTKPIAEAGGRRWKLNRRGVLRYRATARDERTGELVIDMRLRRGGSSFSVDGRRLEWTPGQAWDRDSLLREGGREIASFTRGALGPGVLTVTVADDAYVPPLALLLGCFLVIASSQDTAAAAGAGGGGAGASG
jgi:hypothetical protein